MNDFLNTKRKEIEERLGELEPFVSEYEQLKRAASALADVNGSAPSRPVSATKPRQPGSKPAARKAAASGTAGRRGRPKGSGARAIETLKIVKEKPGITIPELAQRMGIKQNYLYRVLPGLEQDGKVERREHGWHLVK